MIAHFEQCLTDQPAPHAGGCAANSQLHLSKKAAAAIGLTLPADLVAEAHKVLS